MPRVRVALRLVACAAGLLVLVALGFVADLTLNRRRVLYALLGRDGIVAACRPPLEARLRNDGFEPTDIEFGEAPDITLSTGAGRTLADTFTFADGASQTRVDGALACSVKGATVSIDVRTTTTPTRAT
jgi:hypothetical protein